MYIYSEVTDVCATLLGDYTFYTSYYYSRSTSSFIRWRVAVWLGVGILAEAKESRHNQRHNNNYVISVLFSPVDTRAVFVSAITRNNIHISID